MYKVLLVDDEPYIIQGLSIIIDWKAEGFEIVGTANNGLEALNLIKSEKPDLVIADIRMPEMTGLELLEEVRKENLSDASFAILSGYNDFEYAKKAMKFGSMDFMLKPVDRDELILLLEKVRIKCDESRRKNIDDDFRIKEVYSRNIIPLIKGRADRENIENVKRFLGSCKMCRYISVEIDETTPNIRNLDKEEKRNMQRTLYQKCRMHVDHEYKCIFDVSLRNNFDVGIIYISDTDEDDDIYINELKSYLAKEFEFPVKVIAGSKVDDISLLNESARTALLAGFLQSFEPTEVNDNTGLTKGIDKDTIDSLIKAIETNSQSQIISIGNNIYAKMEQSDSSFISMATNYLLFGMLHLALDIDENINQQEIIQSISNSAFEKVYTRGGSGNLVKMLLEFAEYLVQLRAGSSKNILSKVQEDIRSNYMENLTLKDLGNKYFVNAAYLGQMFKKEYGASFKDYLNKVRIEKAEELLLNTEEKIMDIALSVGYNDVDYFINRFIAIKGCTPAKYRKQSR